jgi:hypothetical protein
MLTCRVCGARGPVEGFVRDRRTRSGYRAVCKACERARSRRRYKPRPHTKSRYRHGRPSREYLRRKARTQYAIKMGYLKRPDHCEICREPCKPHAHHVGKSDRDVMWLCPLCHSVLHRAMRGRRVYRWQQDSPWCEHIAR